MEAVASRILLGFALTVGALFICAGAFLIFAITADAFGGGRQTVRGYVLAMIVWSLLGLASWYVGGFVIGGK